MSCFSTSDNESKFQIKSTTEFANRSNMIFNGLNQLEEKHDQWKAETPMVLDLQKPDPSVSEIMDCKGITFKRPRLPLSLKRKRYDSCVPDYVMNPHKWKKYSLTDTPGITEESNTAVALQFLKELKKNREESVERVENNMQSLTYRKPAAASRNYSVDPSEQMPMEPFAASFTCSSVHKMPELVVGEKRPKATKLVASSAKAGIGVKLDHLEDNHDEEL